MDSYFNKKSSESSESAEGGDPLTQLNIGCVIEAYRNLGLGLLESTWERCLAHELRLAGVSFINHAFIT